MSKRDVYKLARELGDIVAQGRATLPRLALAAAAAAKAGQIDEDDAAGIYEEYIKRSQGLNHVEHSSNTIKANVSKLRQIIKCSMNGYDAPHLLRRVEVIHAKARVPVKPLYSAMVDACRAQIVKGHKRLTTEEIMKVITL